MLPGTNGIVYATVNDGGRVFCIVSETEGRIHEATVTLSRVETTDVWLAASNLVSRVPWQKSAGEHRGAVAIHMGDGTIWGQALGSLNLDGFGDVWHATHGDWKSEADDLGATLRHHIACSWKRTFVAGGPKSVRQSSPATEPTAIEWYIRCVRMASAEQYVLYTNLVRDVTERLRVAPPDSSLLVRKCECGRHIWLDTTNCVAAFRALCTNECMGCSLRDLNALVSIIDSDIGRWDGGAVVETDTDSSLRAGMPVAEVVRSLGAPRTTHIDHAVAVGGGTLAMEYATVDGMFLRISVTNHVVDRWLFSNRVAVPRVDTSALWFYRHFLAEGLRWPRCGEWVGRGSAVTQRETIQLDLCVQLPGTTAAHGHGSDASVERQTDEESACE